LAAAICFKGCYGLGASVTIAALSFPSLSLSTSMRLISGLSGFNASAFTISTRNGVSSVGMVRKCLSKLSSSAAMAGDSALAVTKVRHDQAASYVLAKSSSAYA
jgi:hypothetical protein